MSSGPCDECLLGSVVLASIGGVLEVTSPASRPRRLLSLEPAQLLNEANRLGRRKAKFDIESFDLDAERKRISELGVASACRHGGQFEWPLELLNDPEPPWVINALGDTRLLSASRKRIAIVGARRADAYGRETARRIGREAAASGGVVVSGLALGIDAAAHKGALEPPGGQTIAVVGGGVDIPYPRTNSDLHRAIAERGCVISEMPPGTGVWRWSFPARNRLIAALSDVVTIVQAAHGSGSLHTAEAALVRGRTLAAVPGRIDLPISAGSNGLLADGAIVVTDPCIPGDMLGLVRASAATKAPPELAETMEAVESRCITQLLADGGSRAEQLRRDLVLLELEGLVQQLAGGEWTSNRS